MTTLHEDFLELAAASLDFELDPGEREALAEHLAGCVPCRRRVTGMQADQRRSRRCQRSFSHLPVSPVFGSVQAMADGGRYRRSV